MESTTEQMSELSSDQLYDQAVAHYRAARWTEAMACLSELLARGQSSHEVDALIQDIKFKQRLDAVQGPIAASAPRPRRKVGAGFVIALAGGVAAVAIIGVGLAVLISQPAAPLAIPPPVVQVVTGALPTPAPVPPTPVPTATAVGEGTLAVNPVEGERVALGVTNVYFILDASGSMLARLGDQRKIDIAQEAMVGLVERLPETANVALRTYGRQRPSDCSDVELIRPMASLDRAGLIAEIEGIEPVNRSRTPIGNSLEAMAADLGVVSSDTLVVLLTDGEESCDADPVAIAARIHGEQPSLRVSVVGFDIQPELRERMAQIAEAGGGAYYDAADVGQLAAALEAVVTPRFSVIDGAGAEVGGGLVGEQLKLPAGDYTLKLGENPVVFEQAVEVRDGMATLVLLGDDGGRLSADVRLDWSP